MKDGLPPAWKQMLVHLSWQQPGFVVKNRIVGQANGEAKRARAIQQHGKVLRQYVLNSLRAADVELNQIIYVYIYI